MKAGVTLNKLDILRELLEEGTWALTSVGHMRNLIPAIRTDSGTYHTG